MASQPPLSGPALALVLALPTLAACSGSREATTGSIYPADYRDRHPIALQHGPRRLDLFVEGASGLTGRSRDDLAAFLVEHRRHATSGIVAQVPVGTENGAATRRALQMIRAAADGRIAVESYVPSDPTLASPIRLSFKRLEAKVTSVCGTWPEDLGVSDYEFSASNRQYYNFGCASQSNLASQVADPNDLVRGRQQTPPDTTRRMFNIGELRGGRDPTTSWKVDAATIRQSISQ